MPIFILKNTLTTGPILPKPVDFNSSNMICDYLPALWLKLVQVSKLGPWRPGISSSSGNGSVPKKGKPLTVNIDWWRHMASLVTMN